MKIIQFVDSLVIGGAETIALNLAVGLCAKGHTCFVCGVGKNGAMAELLKNKGIHSDCLNTPTDFSLSLIKKIFQLLRSEQADIIVTHHFRQLAHVFLPAKILGCKLVHIEHDYHFYQDKPIILKRLFFLLKFVDSFVCVSSEIIDWFTRQSSGIEHKSCFINNGVDTERFRPDDSTREAIRKDYNIAPESFVVGTCARLEPIKNIELLIDGFAEFRKSQNDSKLCIVGDGTLMQKLQEQTRRLNIEEHVIFAGIQHEVENFLTMFDLYSITSHNEGLPLSVLEAMATGLPVVATNVGALPRLINEQTGVLLDEHTGRSLANAFHALKDNRELSARLGRNGRSFVITHFSLVNMVNQYQDVFYSLERLH